MSEHLSSKYFKKSLFHARITYWAFQLQAMIRNYTTIWQVTDDILNWSQEQHSTCSHQLHNYNYNNTCADHIKTLYCQLLCGQLYTVATSLCNPRIVNMHKGTSFTEHVTLHARTLLFDNSTACCCLRCHYAYRTYTHAYWCLSMPQCHSYREPGAQLHGLSGRCMERFFLAKLYQRAGSIVKSQFTNKINQQY